MRSATHEGEHSAAAYVAATPDWFNSIARPNMLFDASVFLDLYRYGFTPGAQKGFQKQVLAYRDGFSTYFRSRGEVDMLLDTELLALADDVAGAKECAARGLASFKLADEVIAAGQSVATYDQLKAFVPSFLHAVRESIQYGTLVSYWTLCAVEKAGHTAENPGRFTEIFEAFEPLRADSRNLLFREHLYPKVWGIIADRFGIADADLLAGLTFQEIAVMVEEDRIPSQELLARRRAGCVVWYEDGDDALSFDFDQDTFAQVMTLETKDFDGKELRGRIAQKGKVRGTVRIIFSLADAKSFEDGDIIVSSSTNPSLMPYLIRCGAIVTDEGGIASHAAIVARELKKPCIIGTKIATQVLKDGDLVEVDAEKGIVRLLDGDQV